MAGHRDSPQASTVPTFGREEILEEAGQVLSRAREGHGQGLLLVGAGGAGKTHLLRAVMGLGTERGFRILSGHALPEELPPPFSLVRDLLESRDEREPGGSVDASDSLPVPMAFAPFGEGRTSRPQPPGASPRPRTPEDDLERNLSQTLLTSPHEDLQIRRENLLDQIEGYFRTLGHDRPLLVAIDDLHLADTSSLEFLRRFAFGVPESSVVVFATVGEPAKVPERTRVALEEIARSPAFRSVPLRALTVPEATEFVRWIMGGNSPDPNDVLRWHAQTEGNPLFIEQLVHAATGYGPTGGRPPSHKARDVTEILAERVRGLGENDRRVLTYASVLGREFDFGCLRSVIELPEERLSEAVDRLVRGGILRERGAEVYEFASEEFRATLYSGMTETRRQILHKKAGLALEAKGGIEDSELARQFYLGGDNDRTVKYNIAAAQSATRVYAFDMGVTYLARALEAERRRPERDTGVEMRFLLEEGRLLTEMSNLRRSEEVFSEVIALARSHPGHDLELGRALLGLALARYLRGEYPNAGALATEAWADLTSVGTMRDRMAAHRVLGVVYWRRGDLRQAEAHHRAALDIAEREGTPLEQGHALIDVANLILPSDTARFETGLKLYVRAAKLFAEGGDFASQARVLMNRSVLEWAAGRTDEALQDLTTAIEAAERSHSPRWIGYCHINLAQLQTQLGHTELARPALERAVRVFAPVGNEFAEQQILMTRGMIAHADHAYETAETNYQAALKMARDLHLPAETAEMLLHLAELSHARGDKVEARGRLAEAKASGLLDHRPDFASRVNALEQALAGR